VAELGTGALAKRKWSGKAEEERGEGSDGAGTAESTRRCAGTGKGEAGGQETGADPESGSDSGGERFDHGRCEGDDLGAGGASRAGHDRRGRGGM